MTEKHTNKPGDDQLISILNMLNDGVYIINHNYEVVYANDAFIREFGPVDEKKCYEYLCETGCPCHECHLKEVLAGKIIHSRWQSTKTGKIYDNMDAPLKHADGSILKIKIIHNITETEKQRRQVRDLARFSEENPFPMLRLAADGTILYSNTPGLVLVEEWKSRIGEKATPDWCRLVAHTLESGRYHVEDIVCGAKLFSVALAPIAEGGYVNLYGRDITKQKQTEDVLHWSARQNALLSETAARLLQSDDPRGLVDALCRQVMEFLDCQTFFNYLVEEQEGRLHLNACAGISQEEMRNLEWLDFGVAVCGCVARDCQRVIAEDIQKSDNPVTMLIKSYGIQAYCCHPLIVGERLIGTLSFGTRTRTRFKPREIELMQSVTTLVAFAVYRIEAERAIRENEKRLRMAAEAADFGSYNVDLTTGSVYWSPEFKRIIGMAADAQPPAAGKIPDFVHPDDIERIKKMRETSYDPNGNGEIEYEYRIIRPDGQIHWVWLQGQVVFDLVDGRKKAVRSTGVLFDITERKLAEEKLKESFQELSRFNRMAVDRELRMIELKKEVNDLCRQAGQAERYEMNIADGLPASESSDSQR